MAKKRKSHGPFEHFVFDSNNCDKCTVSIDFVVALFISNIEGMKIEAKLSYQDRRLTFPWTI